MTDQDHPERHQTSGFVAQSVRYLRMDLPPVSGETTYISENPILLADPPKRILDVGCGPGYVLKSTLDAFPGSTGVGVEPSPEAVDLLQLPDRSDQRVVISTASAHDLPFPTDSFDLVLCWSVLHWIGRNEYLQALGELIRVSSRHLIVMDFTSQRNHRVPYAHDDRYFTYKSDFVSPILASGIMTLADDKRWIVDSLGVRQPLDDQDLEPFLGNSNNYSARRACLFRKQYSLLPTHSEPDFTDDA